MKTYEIDGELWVQLADARTFVPQYDLASDLIEKKDWLPKENIANKSVRRLYKLSDLKKFTPTAKVKRAHRIEKITELGFFNKDIRAYRVAKYLGADYSVVSSWKRKEAVPSEKYFDDLVEYLEWEMGPEGVK